MPLPRLPLALFCSAIALVSNAQLSGSLYGIHNPQSGVFAFSSLDLSTMVISDIDTLPMGVISSMASGTVDTDQETFLFCTGTTLYSLDPYGLLPTTSVVLPMAGTAFFNFIEYDPCTASLFGFVNDPPDSIVFARYDLASNTFQSLLTMPGNMQFMMGAGSYIDPVNRVYGFENINSIMGIDIDQGTLLYNTPMIDPPGESSGHLSYDCSTGNVLGTSFGAASEGGDGKWVSTVDPLTGVVTHLSNAHTSNALMKPAMTGSCVDQATGVFYWGGINGTWVGANTTTGSIVLDDVSAPLTPLFCVNHFSACACAATNVAEESAEQLPPFPQPANDMVTFPGVRGPLVWVDPAGREVQVPQSRTEGGVLADVGALPSGVYVVRTAALTYRVAVE
ncbi:MAG: hypothetical protein IPJ76_04185 [Flavobacteriales bacterium]|nr:MAG: hypothetical protein IPJ76_04185 [Flavobacteriales bacterium]